MLSNFVRDWMTMPVVTANPSLTVIEARDLMKAHGVRRLPVLDDKRLVGIITIGDIREAAPSDATSLSVWELNYLWSQVTVERVMTRDVVTIPVDATIDQAAEVMLRRKISGLPVMDGDALAGIISESDILIAFMRMRQREDVLEPGAWVR
jgi:CBS domain-containing protein